MVLQSYDGDVERALASYEHAGDVTTDRERELFRERAGCCWRWIERHAPDEFRYRVRSEPVARMLDADQRTVLARLVEVFRGESEIREAALVVHMKALCDGTELTLATFCPLAYDLLIDRDRGPKLTTLLTTIGGERALPLLEASLAGADSRAAAAENGEGSA
jgi:lysyl-tRNA synthetase class 1